MINPQPADERRSPYSPDISAPSRISAPVAASPGTNPPTPEPKPKKKRRWRKIIGYSFLVILVAAGTYGYSLYKSLQNNILIPHEGESSAILKADTNSLNPANFTQPGDGRFNIVVVGVGGDDHPGAYLTDTIQVLSMDTINNSVSLTSVPRDLEVKQPDGSYGKINAVYSDAEQIKAGSGAEAVRTAVGNVLGIKISNFALMDFTGIQEIVDDLGGIDVDVPKAISDPFFPCTDTVHYCPFYITAGQHHMDGATALSYSRSRETTSDFDRSARQQIVIAAIKKKSLSAGVLANPVKISQLISAVGRHFKTDMQVDDISAFFGIYRQVTAANTNSYVLDTSASLGLLTDTTDPVAGYYSFPVLGIGKYSAIAQWFQKNNPDPLLVREKATITVINSGKATTKQLDAFVQKLKDYGFTVTTAASLAEGTYASTTMFEKDTSKPITRNYLTTVVGSAVQTGTLTNAGTDFEIVYVPTSTSSSSN